MEKWYGSAGVCVNEKGQLLMVLQGKPEEKKLWTIPSGGKEDLETFEDCCVREIKEETGYQVEIVRKLKAKEGKTFGIDVVVQYFEVKIVGGTMEINDPDGLIHEVAWKSAKDLEDLDLSFPEDRSFLSALIRNNKNVREES